MMRLGAIDTTIVIIVSIMMFILSGINSRRTIYGYNMIKSSRKDIVFFVIGLVLLAVLCGLRRSINDTYYYLHIYHCYQYPELSGVQAEISAVDWCNFGSMPLWSFVIRICIAWGLTDQTWLMIVALFSVITLFWFVRKYSDDSLSLILVVLTGAYVLNFGAMRQCFALGFVFIGLDRYLRGRRIRFAFWILVSMMIHTTSAIFFLVLILNKKVKSYTTKLLLPLFLILGPLIRIMYPMISGLINLVLGRVDDVDYMLAGSVNPIRIIVISLPLFMSIPIWKRLKNWDEKYQFFFQLYLIRVGFMYCALFINPIFMGRLSGYFCFSEVIVAPKIINTYNISINKKWLKCIYFFVYLAFFIFENGLFGIDMKGISLLQYLMGDFVQGY